VDKHQGIARGQQSFADHDEAAIVEPKADTRGEIMLSKGQHRQLLAQTILVGIPAYNEEKIIGSIVRRITESGLVHKVLVVDDGSSDDTALVAETAGALVLRHQTNLGAGAATRTCFDAAQKSGATILVTLDGDGQHDPDEIPDLLGPILENRADIVIGSRFLTGHNEVPFHRSLGIGVITLLCNLGYGTRVSDAQSCYRAYGERALRSLAITDPGFGFSVETLIEARQKGLTIAEVPVSCIYNSASHTISPLVQGPAVALAVLKHRATQFLGKPINGQLNGNLNLSPVPSREGTPFSK
jgi:glycosyltransferase involved in cell wall biosynthesis